jgi:hypothetical protein
MPRAARTPRELFRCPRRTLSAFDPSRRHEQQSAGGGKPAHHGAPCSRSGFPVWLGRPAISPLGICHRIVPLWRSYAVRVDHGGPIAGSPGRSGDHPLVGRSVRHEVRTCIGRRRVQQRLAAVVLLWLWLPLLRLTAPLRRDLATPASGTWGSPSRRCTSCLDRVHSGTSPVGATVPSRRMTEPRKLGGVYNPSFRACRSRLRHACCSLSGRYGLTSFSVMTWRAKAAAPWGRAVFSTFARRARRFAVPGALRPATRHARYAVEDEDEPCFVGCATTSTDLPSCRMVSSLGAAGRS